MSFATSVLYVFYLLIVGFFCCSPFFGSVRAQLSSDGSSSTFTQNAVCGPSSDTTAFSGAPFNQVWSGTGTASGGNTAVYVVALCGTIPSGYYPTSGGATSGGTDCGGSSASVCQQDGGALIVLDNYTPTNTWSASGTGATYSDADGATCNTNRQTIINFVCGSSPTLTLTEIENPTCTYTFTWTSQAACAAVLGDPQFVGIMGQSYQIHGIDNAVYNIISDPLFQLNSRFVFLQGPRSCPTLPSTGKLAVGCWTHDGSYLGNLGLQTISGDRVLIQSGGANDGLKVLLNGKIMTVSSSMVTLVSNYEVTLHVGAFTIQVENIDGFINLARVQLHSRRNITAHGLLGQTWNNKIYPGSIKVIEGEVDDYVIDEGDEFGVSFAYNRFLK